MTFQDSLFRRVLPLEIVNPKTVEYKAENFFFTPVKAQLLRQRSYDTVLHEPVKSNLDPEDWKTPSKLEEHESIAKVLKRLSTREDLEFNVLRFCYVDHEIYFMVKELTFLSNGWIGRPYAVERYRSRKTEVRQQERRVARLQVKDRGPHRSKIFNKWEPAFDKIPLLQNSQVLSPALLDQLLWRHQSHWHHGTLQQLLE